MSRRPGVQLLLGVLLVSVIGSAQASSREWTFKVFLDDKAIGTHRFEVVTRNNTRHVAVEARFDVRFLFFTAYRYQHSNYEVWQQHCLHSITSKTDDNGEMQFVRGEREGGVLRVTTPAGEKELDGCVKTFAYWDPDFLDSRSLLNAQTGELLPVEVLDLGTKTIPVRGQAVVTRQYRLVTDKFAVDLWYSPQREWLALESTTRDGAVLRYQLQ